MVEIKFERKTKIMNENSQEVAVDENVRRKVKASKFFREVKYSLMLRGFVLGGSVVFSFSILLRIIFPRDLGEMIGGAMILALCWLLSAAAYYSLNRKEIRKLEKLYSEIELGRFSFHKDGKRIRLNDAD